MHVTVRVQENQLVVGAFHFIRMKLQFKSSAAKKTKKNNCNAYDQLLQCYGCSSFIFFERLSSASLFLPHCDDEEKQKLLWSRLPSFWSQYNFYVIPVDIMNTLQREFLRRFMYFVDPKVVIRCGVNKTMKNNKAATTKMKGFPMCLRFILFHFGCSVCNCLPLYKTIRKSISKLKLTIKNSSSSSIHFISIQKMKENPLHLKF